MDAWVLKFKKNKIQGAEADGQRNQGHSKYL